MFGNLYLRRIRVSFGTYDIPRLQSLAELVFIMFEFSLYSDVTFCTFSLFFMDYLFLLSSLLHLKCLEYHIKQFWRLWHDGCSTPSPLFSWMKTKEYGLYSIVLRNCLWTRGDTNVNLLENYYTVCQILFWKRY